nr:unnamed protein product [Callosobruchus analis]
MCSSEKFEPVCNKIYVWKSNKEEFISITNNTLPKINVARKSMSLEGRIIKISASNVRFLLLFKVTLIAARDDKNESLEMQQWST